MSFIVEYGQGIQSLTVDNSIKNGGSAGILTKLKELLIIEFAP